MAAKGKVNMSKVEIGTRILVQPGSMYPGDTVTPALTKTGAGVTVTTVIDKVKRSDFRGYTVITGAGQFTGQPIQTMMLAPEDPAGIRRAHTEALEVNATRTA